MNKHKYINADTVGWSGTVEPDSMAWILFYSADGSGLLYTSRDEGGAVSGSPIRLDG